MKKEYPILIAILVFLGTAFFLFSRNYSPKNIIAPEENSQPTIFDNSSQNQTLPESPSQNSQAVSSFQAPLDRAQERITKKPFGIYITSENSPIRPERFQGYHTGTDFEIFPEELNIDIPVKAVCSGKLFQKKYASGYGGVVVETCELDGSPITVVYGHLKLESISAKAGDVINAGSTLGILGKYKSPETDGERKHLHLGFHKGTEINILGYVQSQPELSGWIDPCFHVCSN